MEIYKTNDNKEWVIDKDKMLTINNKRLNYTGKKRCLSRRREKKTYRIEERRYGSKGHSLLYNNNDKNSNNDKLKISLCVLCGRHYLFSC